MKKLLLLLALSSPCFGQALPNIPPAFAAFVSSDGTGAKGTWDPLAGTGGLTALPNIPPAAGLYYSNDGTGNKGTWVPWTGSGGGGGGGPVLETNGVANASQTLLNLIQGTNITLTNSGGGVTINSTAGGATFPSSPSSALFTYTSMTAGRAATSADIGTILKTVESPSYATIELAVAACGGTFPCQINLSSALTQSTSGTYAPPAGVVIAGQAGGSITPGSGNTLDLSNAPFSGPPVAFFPGAGTIVGMRGATPVEWFGAALPYTSITAAAAGPDDSAKFQATINSITQGGWAQIRCGYYHSNNVVITQNNPVNGIKGDCPGYSYPSASQASVIVSTSASADIIHIEGTSSVYAQWETVENLSTQRAVLPTGTSTGVWASFAGGLTVRNVQSQDSIQLFYSHATPGESKGVWENIGGGWGHSIVSGYTTQTVTGINLDSLDGNAENSIFLNNVGFDCSPISSTSVTSTDMLIKGTHINDVDVTYAGGAGCSYGLHIDYTGTGGLDETADIHIDKPLYDECLISCLLFENISSGGSGSVSVTNGYLEESGGAGVRIVDLENSSGISITGSQIFNIVGSSGAQVGIYANSSNFLTLSNNTLQNLAPGTGIQLNATTGSSVTGNTFLGTSSFVMTRGISLTATSTGNSISGNSASGNITTAYVFDGTSLANDFGLNSCSGGSIGTCVSGVPTGTAPSFLGAGSVVNGVTLSSTGSSSLFLTQVGTYASVSGSTGISGATAGQALIAGSATTATSSIAINGAGAGLVTGPSAPTSGDVAFFTGGAGAITDGLIAGANLVTAASALTANQIVLGAGSKTTAVLGSLGTTTTVLHGNAAGAPSFGAVVLTTDVSGLLPIANGGTGSATAAANTVFGNPTGSSAAPSYTSAPSVVTLTTSTSTTSPLFLSGTPAITDTGIWLQATGNTNSYYQASLQNTNAGATASTDLVINNDQATATTHFIDMGINSSGFTGTGSLNIAGAGYLYTNTGDFVLGTSTANAIHFVYNSGTTDTMLVNANGVSFPTITTTASTAPACFNGTLGSLTNVGCASAAPAFSAITSGTNTTAAMIVGAGGSLTFTSTGTINASTLGGLATTGGAAAVTTGPTTTVSGRLATFTNSTGGLQDSGVNMTSVIQTTGAQTKAGILTLSSHLQFTQTTAPVASSCGGGTVSTGSTDNVFSVTGITAATACTITFNSAIQRQVCVGNASTGIATGPTAISTAAVTFGMAALTGTLYGICF